MKYLLMNGKNGNKPEGFYEKLDKNGVEYFYVKKNLLNQDDIVFGYIDFRNAKKVQGVNESDNKSYLYFSNKQKTQEYKCLIENANGKKRNVSNDFILVQNEKGKLGYIGILTHKVKLCYPIVAALAISCSLLISTPILAKKGYLPEAVTVVVDKIFNLGISSENNTEENNTEENNTESSSNNGDEQNTEGTEGTEGTEDTEGTNNPSSEKEDTPSESETDKEPNTEQDPYDDEHIDIDSPGDKPPTNSEQGEITSNLYSSFTISKGDYIPLTNLSENAEHSVYFVYSIIKGENVIYKSDKIYPGYQVKWIASDYLDKGVHATIFNIDVYDIETGFPCQGFWFPVTITYK